MTTRAEAIARLSQQPDAVRPGLDYEVEAFRPSDAEGVCDLFYRVYKDAYPLDMYYIPDAVRDAVEKGALHPVVARLPGGEIVGFAALYHSSPPFAGLLEFGLGMVHPAYRGSLILFHLTNELTARMTALPSVEAVFGEAVCDTIITQHSSSLFGFREVALELELMPGDGSGRISCLVMFRNIRDRRRLLHAPAFCAQELRKLVAWAELDREVAILGEGPHEAESTRLTVQIFPHARVMRGNVYSLAGDGAEALRQAEAAAMEQGCSVFQWFLNLAEPSAAAGGALLRQSGYRLGGLLPRWFDDDALLMQKLLDAPLAEHINLYSDRAREILAWTLPEPAREPTAG
ncbi:MAG: hypothetical protein P4L39_08310 [Humidesulfovibrio sp.]|nr:hypothetical protein [Humidesulfovibrio sp.]